MLKRYIQCEDECEIVEQFNTHPWTLCNSPSRDFGRFSLQSKFSGLIAHPPVVLEALFTFSSVPFLSWHWVEAATLVVVEIKREIFGEVGFGFTVKSWHWVDSGPGGAVVPGFRTRMGFGCWTGAEMINIQSFISV